MAHESRAFVCVSESAWQLRMIVYLRPAEGRTTASIERWDAARAEGLTAVDDGRVVRAQHHLAVVEAL
eukprot:6726824-Prymnesium_polylepis.2